MRYSGKTALVTGAASGMGEAFCHRFAAEGAQVAVLDVDEVAGACVAESIVAKGGRARFVRADVTDEASMAQAVAATVRWAGGLDVAVNNAGIAGARQLLTEVPLDVWRRAIDVNLTGVFLSLRAELPAMSERGGAIINMASITSVVAHPMAAAYVATKHAVVGLTKSAALEWGSRNIRINAVAPTWVRTPMTTSVFTEERWRELDAKHALGRCATMEEVADLVAFLGSDEAKIITGSVYLADAGYTAA